MNLRGQIWHYIPLFSTTMKYITLGKLAFPAIGLGTYKIIGPQAIDIIRNAILMGYRHLDTAQLYDNEKEVGRAFIESGIPRNEIFITTKVWPSNLSEDKFFPSVEESLAKLKIDHADLLLVHWPHHLLPVEDYIPRLIQAQQVGLTKEIGVSNFNIAQLKSALKAGANIVTNQVEFHPWINQVKLIAFLKKNNITLTAYCPLGQGRFIADKKLETLAVTHARTPAQIILRWMMQKDEVLAIPKSTNLYRLRENINVFDFELSEHEMEIIDAWRLENTRVVGAQAGAIWD